MVRKLVRLLLVLDLVTLCWNRLFMFISSSRGMGPSWIILAGTDGQRFCKEKKHICFNYLYCLISVKNSPLLYCWGDRFPSTKDDLR